MRRSVDVDVMRYFVYSFVVVSLFTTYGVPRWCIIGCHQFSYIFRNSALREQHTRHCHCCAWFIVYNNTHGERPGYCIQQKHEILSFSQSIAISIPDTEHNEVGTVPTNCGFSFKFNQVSCSRFSNVEGMILPVNALVERTKLSSFVNCPNADGMVPVS